MSIFGAMFSGVTGLNAQSQALGMIADNIANVNTIGYKDTRARFFSLVTQAASRTTFTPGGVASSPAQAIDKQGLLQASASKTDIAIAGRGFFVVNQTATSGSGQFLFTRAGSFDPDQNGNLVNTAGYYLQGWPLINGTTLPTNTSTLSSVQTVNVANLAGTATPTSTVNLALNLPSTAPAAAGGGQINTGVATALAGITDIDYKGFGTLNDVEKVTYNTTGNILTITIGGQTGTFDLSDAVPGIYKSTGTLAGIEITVSSAFDFNTAITTAVSTAVVGAAGQIQLSTEGAILEAANSNLDKANVVFDFKGATSFTYATDDYVTVDFVDATDVLTVKYYAANGTLKDTATGIDLTSSLLGGTQTFTLAGTDGTPDLTGVTITLDVDALNGANAATTVATAVKSGGGDLVLNGTSLIAASTVFDGTEVANFTDAAVAFVVATDGTIASTTTAGYTVTLTNSDFNTDTNTPTIRIRHDATTSDFIVEFTAIATAAASATSTVTVNLNELLNAYSIQVKADLALETTIDPGITITSSTFDATDLAALSQKTMTLAVSSAGVVTVKAGTGPTGFTVDATNSQNLDATGPRNVILTNGTNSFTVQIDVDVAISKGAGAEIVVDLKELENSFGLDIAPGNGRFSATMQIFDSLGNAHDLIMDFDKTATNQWEILVNDPVLASTGVTSGTVAPASRSITFNGDGTPASITFPPIVISAWTTGANDSSVAISLGTINTAAGVTQFAGDFALSSIDQDGVTFGGFVGVNIAEDGKVTAVFDNGEQLAIFQLPLSLFANPNGLESVTGNAFRQTDKSGDILLQQAKSGGSGSVASSALESSTVDLADEFTKMITTQRAYSAAAKIITTADEMLEELIRIRR